MDNRRSISSTNSYSSWWWPTKATIALGVVVLGVGYYYYSTYKSLAGPQTQLFTPDPEGAAVNSLAGRVTKAVNELIERVNKGEDRTPHDYRKLGAICSELEEWNCAYEAYKKASECDNKLWKLVGLAHHTLHEDDPLSTLDFFKKDVSPGIEYSAKFGATASKCKLGHYPESVCQELGTQKYPPPKELMHHFPKYRSA